MKKNWFSICVFIGALITLIVSIIFAVLDYETFIIAGAICGFGAFIVFCVALGFANWKSKDKSE